MANVRALCYFLLRLTEWTKFLSGTAVRSLTLAGGGGPVYPHAALCGWQLVWCVCPPAVRPQSKDPTAHARARFQLPPPSNPC